MGGKGVEPLRTFVHTVLSRARLPFRHPPITEYILENCAAFCKKSHFFRRKKQNFFFPRLNVAPPNSFRRTAPPKHDEVYITPAEQNA